MLNDALDHQYDLDDSETLNIREIKQSDKIGKFKDYVVYVWILWVIISGKNFKEMFWITKKG